MTRLIRPRRRLAAALLVIGGVLVGGSLVSEWRGAIWWSRVTGQGVNPGQWFVMFAYGEVRVGWRSTAGFFNRAIMAEGVSGFASPRSRLFCPAERVLMAWRYSEPQVFGYVLPVVPIGAALLGLGLWMKLRRVLPPGACRGCGYDMEGLEGGTCPECGRLASPCASSTSQRG